MSNITNFSFNGADVRTIVLPNGKPVAGSVERPVSPRTKDELVAAHWRSKTCAQFDDPSTVRTGREWFSRYMLHPWERGSDFELVANVRVEPLP